MQQVKKLKNLENLSYFNKNTLAQFFNLSDNSLYANIKRWVKDGELIQLKKGWYVTVGYVAKLLNKEEYREFLANKLREPSYLSLEYVLQKFSVLTEAIYAYTSITLKSRNRYTNQFGSFLYRQITPKLFTGYSIKSNNEFTVKEASKAKSLFDYLYLKNYRLKTIIPAQLQSYRFNLDEFNQNDWAEFAKYCQLTKIKKFLDLPKLIFTAYDL